jgi:hypothetical protein
MLGRETEEVTVCQEQLALYEGRGRPARDTPYFRESRAMLGRDTEEVTVCQEQLALYEGRGRDARAP